MNYGDDDYDYSTYAQAPAAGGDLSSGHGHESPSGSLGSQPRAAQTLSPVTIYQLLTAQQNITEDSFRVDRKELQHITFIGLVIRIEETETVVTYTIDDGTGNIPVKFWLEQRSANPLWREGLYVRVFGNIRSFADERNVIAFKLVEVPDLNELVYHQLEVLSIHVASKQEQGSLVVAQSTAGSSSSSSSTALPPTTSAQPNDIRNYVYEVIKSQTSNVAGNVGISRADLANLCQGHLNDSQLSNLIESLISTGHIYPSIDDFHYKASEFGQ